VVPYPFHQVPAQPWARLDLSGLSAGAPVSIDGLAFGNAPGSLMLGAGRHQVRAAGQTVTVQLVAGSDTVFKPTPVAEKEVEPPSEDQIADLQRALKEQRPKLRACYEKWLKANPAASGTVDLTLVVGKNGKVRSARVDEPTIPRESVDCLVRTARSLVLPPLGSEQEIEVPLVMTPPGR
jgi:hypothetical protein